MANVKIDLSKLDPELSKRIDDVREKADELSHAARDLYMYIGYDMTAECENTEETDSK